jgi:hypothetical protein
MGTAAKNTHVLMTAPESGPKKLYGNLGRAADDDDDDDDVKLHLSPD